MFAYWDLLACYGSNVAVATCPSPNPIVKSKLQHDKPQLHVRTVWPPLREGHLEPERGQKQVTMDAESPCITTHLQLHRSLLNSPSVSLCMSREGTHHGICYGQLPYVYSHIMSLGGQKYTPQTSSKTRATFNSRLPVLCSVKV